MEIIPENLNKLISFFIKLPGIGPRQASRLSFFVAHYQPKTLQELAKLFWNISQKIKVCDNCYFIFEAQNKDQHLCPICLDKDRDHKTICVVEKDTDLISIEKTNKFKGEYHILGGLLSSVDVKKEMKLTIKQLLNKIKKSIQQNDSIEEVILALNPTAEGHLTSLYLKKLLEPYKIKVTQLGIGIPYGSEIEFADPDTLAEALKKREP